MQIQLGHYKAEGCLTIISALITINVLHFSPFSSKSHQT